MKTWEYKIINVRSENYSMDPRRAEELNRLGDEGWELVSMLPRPHIMFMGSGNNYGVLVIMRRSVDFVGPGPTLGLES